MGAAAILALVGIFAVAAQAVILRSSLRRRWGGCAKTRTARDALQRPTVTALALAWLVAPTSALAVNAYITNSGDNTVSVIDTATNTVIGSPLAVGSGPIGAAVTPDGSKVYVANAVDNTVSVIVTATNTVIGSPIPVGTFPVGDAVTPDGSKVYVTNLLDSTVSVIATATNTVVGSPIAVGNGPETFGQFIQPPPRFAGTPGFSNCHGQSVAAFARQFGGLNAAAAALGFPSVRALQELITAFCHG